jgi:hypothetical protein
MANPASPRNPATATPASPALTGNASACCGEGGVWAPRAGEPSVAGCALCPQSPTYWRSVTNRADGEPYEPVRALGADMT